MHSRYISTWERVLIVPICQGMNTAQVGTAGTLILSNIVVAKSSLVTTGLDAARTHELERPPHYRLCSGCVPRATDQHESPGIKSVGGGSGRLYEAPWARRWPRRRTLARCVQRCAHTLRQLAARQALSAAAAFPGLRGHLLPRPAGPGQVPLRLCPRRHGLCGQPGRAGRGVLQRGRGAGAHDAGGLHHTIKASPKTANRAARAQLYEPFYADFGPLNLGHAYKFCRRTAELVQVAITSYISRTPISL